MGWPALSAPAAWFLLAVLPGRAILTLAGLDRIDQRPDRLLLGLVASLAIVPVLLNPVWHFTNQRVPLLIVAAAVNVALLAACALRSRQPKPAAQPLDVPTVVRPRATRVLMLVIALFLAFATIGPYWPATRNGHPIPSAIHDFIKHHAVLYSLEHQPLPLGNPFFADEGIGPVYYYHFFYLIPATVRAIAGGPSIELAFGVQSFLVAFATVGMFYLCARRIHNNEGSACLAAILAAFVGGWDIIPTLLLRMPVVTLDSWADHLVRIHSLLNQMIWSPQNIFGVTIFLFGVYIWSARGLWRGWLVLGPLLIAAIHGASIWVAIPALVALPFVVHGEIRRRAPFAAPGETRRAYAAATLVALLGIALLLPVQLGYDTMSERHGKGLTVRWPYQSHALIGRIAPPGVLANFLDLPWVLLIELGPLIILPLLLPYPRWHAATNYSGMRYALWAGGVATVGFCIVRSHFKYNDFGQKTMLVAMSAGLLVGAGILHDKHGAARWWNPFGWTLDHRRFKYRDVLVKCALVVTLLLGLPVSLYEAPLTAIRRFVSPDGRWAKLIPAPVVTSIPEGPSYSFIRDNLPASAVLQPYWGVERANLVQLTNRQIGVSDLEADVMVFYPTHPEAHALALADLRTALDPTTPAATTYRLLATHGITDVYMGAIERARWGELPQFHDPQYFTPVFRDAAATVFSLNPAAR